MTEQNRSPEEILNRILAELASGESGRVRAAITELEACNYSSPAIINQLEQLALQDDEEIRKEALAILNTSTHRYIRSRVSKLDFANRKIMLDELATLQKQGLLEASKADVIKLRYNFDIAPPPAKPTHFDQTRGRSSPIKPAVIAHKPESVDSPPPYQPVPKTAPVEPKPVTPAAPRRTLTEALLSETSIKIALYLGAFFVIASAAIIAALLGATFDSLRIPLLIFATIIFGGVSVAIRMRLPQPSFAFFIVFSFLLPITANVIEQTLNLSAPISAAYWVFVSAFMALIWAGSTWLYESRLFSITAFISFVVALYRVGDIFEAAPEFYPTMLGLTSLTGLLGVWALKKWKDANFALPLFLTAQLLQVITLGISVSYFFFQLFNESTSSPLWNLAAVFTWGFAFLFYALSDLLFPFLFFPWLAAGTLFAIPWFIGAAFKLETLGGTILFFIWGFLIAASSEAIHRFEKALKYSLPVLLVSIVTAGTAMIYGFAHNETTGFVCALSVAIVYAALHIIRPRGWLWAFALFDFIIAYFTFFNLPFIQKANIFFGYQLLGLSILFLLPDLFIEEKSVNRITTRVIPTVMRIYGALFTVWSLSVYIFLREELLNTAIMFGIYALFFAIYTIAQRKAFYGYLPAAYLPLTIFFTLNHFNIDAWLPALTGLAVLYFIIGVAIRPKEAWSIMLRNSALVLGTLVSLGALITFKETGGWYALVVGLLFAAEMYLSRDGWFEIGVPAMFNIGAFLILRDLNIDKTAYHLLAYSLVWLGSDLISHLAFKDPRPLKWIVRGIGTLLVIVNFGFLFFNADTDAATIGFGIYTLFFLTYSLLYREPNLFYAFTLTLPLFITFLFREFDLTKWIHPVIVVAMIYYALGYFFRLTKRASGWDSTLLFSGLGLGLVVSFAAPILGGLDAAIPVAFAATLWAVEAFWRKNAWLGFPANGLYLLAYFIILFELKVDQPQFFSMGAALLGMIQHYLLIRAENKTGAFIMGMVSQLTLLGTTYIQMVSNGSEGLIYFVVLFFQSIAVLVYGVIIRSRSLTFMPIFFSVVGVLSVIYIVVYKLLDVITTIMMVGCTGLLLLVLGIVAVLMRERISKLGEKLSAWKA